MLDVNRFSLISIICGSIIALALSAVLRLSYDYLQQTAQWKHDKHPASFEGTDHHSRVCAALSEELPFMVFASSHPSFSRSVNSYWSLQERELRPRCVVIPRETIDVSDAIRVLKHEYDAELASGQPPLLRFAVRSGGHSPEYGFSNVDGGVLIDLSRLNQITVSADQTSTVVGPGARWKDVYAKLDDMGLAVAGGRSADVGVGGLVLGGGISFFSPRVGFVCSNVDSYEMVLANGTIATASSTHNPDLWRALKGGSNNFGIMTAANLRTFASGKIWAGSTFHLTSAMPQLLKAFNDLANPYREADEYAAGPILAVGYVQRYRMAGAANFLAYTKPEKWPKHFDGFKAIRRLWSTVKIRTLSSAAEALRDQAPHGRRQFQVTTTVQNNLDTLEAARTIYQDSVASIRGTKDIIYNLVYQHVPPAAISKGSTDSLGLAPRNATSLVIVLVTVSWMNKEDDEHIERVSRNVIADVEAYAEAKGTADRYRYLNYAASGQDVIGGYGDANKRFLQETSRSCDPQGLFQRACVGGFKLGIEAQ